MSTTKRATRSKTADLVRQRFDGLMLAHFAIRGLLHEAALTADVDPDRLSFVHAVRVVGRRLTTFHAIPPQQRKRYHKCVLQEILQERVVSSPGRRNASGVKRKMSKFPIRPRHARRIRVIDIDRAISIIK